MAKVIKNTETNEYVKTHAPITFTTDVTEAHNFDGEVTPNEPELPLSETLLIELNTLKAVFEIIDVHPEIN